MKKALLSALFTITVLLASVAAAFAQEEPPATNSGDTAWILTATALVLFMTIPGLSLFYAGLVRDRNVLSVLMHCFTITCVMTIVWLVLGYSMAFTEACWFSGGFQKVFLKGTDADAVWPGTGIPELLFFAFQMTFFIITPALIVGTFVERMKFSAMLLFMILWSLLVYAPICHMVWGGGSLFGLTGVMDHAGGIVVHITAGVGALVACIVVGKRQGWPHTPMPPHNLPMTITGTAMLWVGWFGFNAGSGLAANGGAAMSLVVTHVSAATAAFTWMLIEWTKQEKPSMLGIATGSIAGLAAITPASGAVGPIGALCIGAASGALCWFFCARVKAKFGYDDSLDVVGVHGVGGTVGTILVSVFAAETFGGSGTAKGSIGAQFTTQLLASAYAIVYTLIVTVIILKLVGMVTRGLRVTETDELQGLDLTSHGESGYNT